MMEIEIGGESVVIQQHEERQTEYVPTEAQSTAVEKVYWLYVFNQPDSSTVTSWCEAPLHEGNWQGPDNDGCFSMVSKSDKRNPCPMCSCSCMMGAVTEQITVQSLNRGEDQQVIDNACVDNVMKEDDNSLSQSFSTHDSQDEAATFEVVAEIPIHEQQCDDDDDDDDDGEMNSEIDGMQVVQADEYTNISLSQSVSLVEETNKQHVQLLLDIGDDATHYQSPPPQSDINITLSQNDDNVNELHLQVSESSRAVSTETNTLYELDHSQIPVQYLVSVQDDDSAGSVDSRLYTESNIASDCITEDMTTEIKSDAPEDVASSSSASKRQDHIMPKFCRSKSELSLLQNVKLIDSYEPANPPPGSANKRNHICPQCHKGFFKSTDLNKHLVTHTKDSLYVCDVCSKTFKHHSSLYTHKFIHMSEDQRPFPCHLCPRRFFKRALLKRHLRSHVTGVTCHICGTTFHKPFMLTHHMKRHGNVTSTTYNCEHCQIGFKTKRSMEVHVSTIHLKNTPFKCEECGQSFDRKTRFEYHKKSVHQKQPQHLCDHCGVGYRCPHSLKRHIAKQHTKELNFKCNDCGMLFAISRDVQYHRQRVHEKQKY